MGTENIYEKSFYAEKRKCLFIRAFTILCLFFVFIVSSQTAMAAEESYTVTYHANGGTFEDGSDTNVVTYGPPTAEKVTKTSKTSNVSSDGSSYSGGYGDNKAITDKVTIPGAKELKVTITYAMESTSYDWVCVYDGKTTPSASNYSSSISGKLGGTTKTTKTYTVTGDTVQFFFRSDGSSSNYYGYYATVEGTGTTQKVQSGSYQKPNTTEKEMKFGGWYTDESCTDGNEFDSESVTKSQDVYAKYVKVKTIESGTTGGVTWKLYEDGLLKIYPTNGISGTMESYDSSSSVPWNSYQTQIKSVKIEKGVKAGSSCTSTFSGCNNLVIADVKDLDISNVTSMNHMFYGCSSLTRLDVGGWDTSGVTDMGAMFSSCSKLATLNVENWNMGNVTDISYMFENCSSLSHLDLSKCNLKKLNNMNYLVRGCDSLVTLNLSGIEMNDSDSADSYLYGFDNLKSIESINLAGLKAPRVTYMSYFFQNSPKLKSVDMSNANLPKLNILESAFRDCSSLEKVNFKDMKVPSVEFIQSMFKNCSKLKEVDMSCFKDAKLQKTYSLFEGCSNLISVDLSDFNTEKIYSLNNMFTGCTKLENVEMRNWTFESTYPSYLFQNVTSLKTVDISGWSGFTLFDSLFNGCTSLTTIKMNNIDTSKVSSMYDVFKNCTSLESLDLSGWNLQSLNYLNSIFGGCTNLKTINLSNWDVRNVSDINGLFDNLTNVNSINLSNWNAENIQSVYGMFQNMTTVEEINMSNWENSNLTSLNSMFKNCSSLKSIDLSSFNTTKVYSMYAMFQNCTSLQSVNLSSFDTTNLSDATSMFENCENLISIDLSNFNTPKINYVYYMFKGCTKLTSIDIGGLVMSNISYDDNYKEMLLNLDNLKYIRFSDDINPAITKDLKNTWIHTRTIDGEKVYDNNIYTGEQMSAMTKEQLSGVWKRPYSSDNIKNPDGTYEYVTDDDLWTINGNAWTYTFNVFDDSVPFYFWEENLPGFSSQLMLKDDGTLPSIGTTGTSKAGTVTNKQNVDSGSLKISKTVVGGDTETKFKFTITLTGDHIKDACEFSDVLFTKGVGSITLKDGESKTIEGIPDGTSYSVEETQTGLYQSRGENTSGTIEKDQIKEVSFTNREIKDNPPDENTEVNVTVSKKVLPEKNKETGKYQMSAAFTGLKANTSYGLSDGTEFTSDSNGNGYVEFALAQDEELVFLHLPVGCTYQFTEAAGDYTSSYEVTDDQNAGTIAKNEDKNTEEKQELSTGKETAEVGENVKVTFINEIQYLQNLTLTKKTIKADGSAYDSKEAFSFTITFSNLKPGENFNSSVGKIKADDDGIAEKTIMLKNGEKAEFYKIPAGTEYQITEERNDYKPAYRIDAKTVVKKENSGKGDQDFSTEIETIDMGENDVVAFTNEVSEWYTLPETGSHALELLAGAAMIALALGYTKRKRTLQK